MECDQRRVAFDADDRLRLGIHRCRLVGQPVVVAPDNVLLYLGGQGIDEDFFRHLHLIGHLGARHHFVPGVVHVGDDHLAQFRVILLGGAGVDRILDVVVGYARDISDAVVGRVAQARDDTDEFPLLQTVRLEIGETLRVVAQTHAELRIGSELEDRRFHSLGLEIVS